MNKRWNFFISHASEDKDIVREMAERLTLLNYRVWYDEFVLNVGDSLLSRINEGLSNTECGILILSHNFFSKELAEDGTWWTIAFINSFIKKRGVGDLQFVTNYINTVWNILAI